MSGLAACNGGTEVDFVPTDSTAVDAGTGRTVSTERIGAPQPTQIVPGLTPGADEFTSQTVWVTWPDSSRSDARFMCARSVVAWGTCILLGAPAPDSDPTSLVVTATDGEPSDVELWLLGPEADLDQPIRLLATVPATTFVATGTAIVSFTDLAIQEGDDVDSAVAEACDEPVELGDADTTLALCAGFGPTD
jgi:hypothetical protein